MRFLLKIGFWVALVAFFLPSFGEGDSQSPGVNYFGAFAGAQQALSDMGGFCERSPAACAAGQDVGSFVAARVTDGLAYGYAAIHGRVVAEPQVAASRPAATPVAATPAAITPAVTTPAARSVEQAAPAPSRPQTSDPMQTAALAAERVRRTAGLEPFAMPTLETRAARVQDPRPVHFVHAGTSRSIPTPTPRP